MNPSRATPQQLVANNDGRKPHWPRPLLLPRPSPSPSLDRMNNSKCARGINEMSWSMRKEGRKVTAVGSHKQFLRQEEDKIRIRGPKILLVICKLKKKNWRLYGKFKKKITILFFCSQFVSLSFFPPVRSNHHQALHSFLSFFYAKSRSFIDWMGLPPPCCVSLSRCFWCWLLKVCFPSIAGETKNLPKLFSSSSFSFPHRRKSWTKLA